MRFRVGKFNGNAPRLFKVPAVEMCLITPSQVGSCQPSRCSYFFSNEVIISIHLKLPSLQHPWLRPLLCIAVAPCFWHNRTLCLLQRMLTGHVILKLGGKWFTNSRQICFEDTISPQVLTVLMTKVDIISEAVMVYCSRLKHEKPLFSKKRALFNSFH